MTMLKRPSRRSKGGSRAKRPRQTHKQTAKALMAAVNAMSTDDFYREARLMGSSASPQLRQAAHARLLLKLLKAKELNLLLDLRTVQTLRQIVGQVRRKPSGRRSRQRSKPR